MGSTSPTDRRSFLKSSALVAAPLAVVAAPAAAFTTDNNAQRLARIEDERAIEAVHRGFLRQPQPKALRGLARKGETIRAIAADPEADPAPIEFAKDGQSATARHRCTVQFASQYDGHSTIEQMARLQGNAVAVRSKRCVILAHYKKERGQWTLASVETA